MMYAVDKLMATFVGRPPRISRRYCSVQVPLDLEISGRSIMSRIMTIPLMKVSPPYRPGPARE